MLDFSRLEQYRENNRIEAKKALGGLPKSIWETYSAFANTLGGVILLGVIETADKTFDSVNLPDPDSLIREFWRIINDPLKVSVNILAAKDVYVEEVNGDRIIVIKVPRADRADKPVYVDNDIRNTYQRSGEGDYRCTYEEYQAMVHDAAIRSPDMHLVCGMGLEALNFESIRSFRQRMKLYRPGHMWEHLDDEAFLQKIGAVGESGGSLRPTSAGLLMFGNREDILRAYPNYAMTYREQIDAEGRWTDTAWSGNAYEFYYWAYNKLQQDVKTPFKLENGRRVDDTPVKSYAKCWPTALSMRIIMGAAASLSVRVIRRSHSPTPAASACPSIPLEAAACLPHGMPRWRGCFALLMWASTPAVVFPTCTASGKPRAGRSRFSRRVVPQPASPLRCI